MFVHQVENFTAWFVFQGADNRNFWRIFTRRGWRHCFLILPSYYPERSVSAERHSVVVDPTANCMIVETVFMSPDQMARHFLKEGATCVIKFKVDRRKFPAYVPRGILTCVSVPKLICGIRAWNVLTPQHLARWLIRNGGQMIERYQPE